VIFVVSCFRKAKLSNPLHTFAIVRISSIVIAKMRFPSSKAMPSLLGILR
jgi:hypothetical protein